MNNVSCESKVACKLSKEMSKNALNRVLIPAQECRGITVQNRTRIMDLQNKNNILVAKQWKIRYSVPMSYIICKKDLKSTRRGLFFGIVCKRGRTISSRRGAGDPPGDPPHFPEARAGQWACSRAVPPVGGFYYYIICESIFDIIYIYISHNYYIINILYLE